MNLKKWYVLPYFIVSSLDNKIKNFQFTGKNVINPYIKEVYHAPFSLLSVRRIPVVYHDFSTGGGGGGGMSTSHGWEMFDNLCIKMAFFTY